MPATDVSSQRRIVRTLLRRGPKFDVEVLSTHGRDGSLIEREVIRHPGAVTIVPILRDALGQERVVFIHNFRLSLERAMLELPAGTRVPGEDPLVCAGRELQEETGYRAGRLRHIAQWHTGPGMTDEVMHCVAAEDLTLVGQQLENDEDILPVLLEPARAMGLVWSGELTDAKSVIALHWAVHCNLIRAS